MNASDVLEDWRQRAEDSQYTHYRCAQYYESRHKILGGIVAGISAFVATSIFATLQQNIDASSSLAPRIFIGMISILAAILASLQTFLGFAEKAEKHRTAGANYGSIQREIQEALANCPQDTGGFFRVLRGKFDDFAKQSPTIPKRLWDRVHKEYGLKP